MKKAAFYSKWLDDSNGLVKDSSNEFMEQNETGTLLLAMPSHSAAGLLARMVKGVVSFLQNLLSPQTRKEGVRCGQKAFRLREIFQTTAIGALYGLLFASLLLAPLPRMESQPYGGRPGITSQPRNPSDCSPPPSFDFRWMDDYMSEEKKEEIFCALWDGETVTFRVMLRVPEIFGLLLPSLGFFRTFTVSNWEELNTTGYTLKDQVKEMNDLDKAFKTNQRNYDRLVRAKKTCRLNCATAAAAAALVCLTTITAPPAFLACEAGVLITELACFAICQNNFNAGRKNLDEDFEDIMDEIGRVIAL